MLERAQSEAAEVARRAVAEAEGGAGLKAEAEAEAATLRAIFAQKERQLQAASAKLEDAEAAMATKAAEVDADCTPLYSTPLHSTWI